MLCVSNSGSKFVKFLELHNIKIILELYQKRLKTLNPCTDQKIVGNSFQPSLRVESYSGHHWPDRQQTIS